MSYPNAVLKYLLAFSLWVIASVLALKFLPMPWAWVYLFLIVILAWFIRHSGSNKQRLLLVYLSTIPVALLVVEIGTWVVSGHTTITVTDSSNNFTARDNVLGYAPRPGAIRNIRMAYKDETIFDVTYTINNDGLRHTPGNNQKATECILLFGGSYAFGWGLKDTDTFLSILGEQLDNSYRLLNFGFTGYGAHQILSAVERGHVAEKIAGCESTTSVYIAIPEHIGRAAGYYWWDKHGPRYILSGNSVVLAGSFDSVSPVFIRARFATMASVTLSPVLKRVFIGYRPTSNEDKSRYLKIVDKARNYLENPAGDARFIAILFDASNHDIDQLKQDSDTIIRYWSDHGYEFYLAGDILDGYRENPSPYYLHKLDKHPSSFATKKLAGYVAARLRSR